MKTKLSVKIEQCCVYHQRRKNKYKVFKINYIAHTNSGKEIVTYNWINYIVPYVIIIIMTDKGKEDKTKTKGR